MGVAVRPSLTTSITPTRKNIHCRIAKPYGLPDMYGHLHEGSKQRTAATLDVG